MKLPQFNALCKEVWQEFNGEIVTLWLTEESYKELREDSLMAGVADRITLYVRSDYEDLGPAHPAFNNVINPVTRTPVRMRVAKDRDIADIFSLKSKQAFSRVIKEDCGDPQPV